MRSEVLKSALMSATEYFPNAFLELYLTSVLVTTRLRGKFNARTSGSDKSCVPVFEEKYPKIHSEFATPFLKAKTEEDCQNACVTDMRCVSYQIDTKPGRVLCWLQLDKAHLVLDNMIDSPNVTEYILVSRCGDLGDYFQLITAAKLSQVKFSSL